MKARITVIIGIAVTVLSTFQFFTTFSSVRLTGIAVGIFFIVFGWKIGWVEHRKFTLLLGHVTLTIGCLVCAYAVYQLPFIKFRPSIVAVLDMPLFWGLFTIFGGYCMITHSYCRCTIAMHETGNCPKSKHDEK